MMVPQAAHAAHEGVQVVALTESNRLVTVLADNPGTALATTRIRGLADGEKVLGIDFRPSNNKLYGFIRAASGGARIAVIDRTTGNILSSATATVTATGLPVELNGDDFGVDFNPVADRLRVVSDAEQSLRINVDTGGTTVDGSLAYAAGDAGAGSDPSVVAAAYTNSDTDPTTATTLYDIDAARDYLVVQNPPNAGTLASVGGGLGLDAGKDVGFDVYTEATEAGIKNVALIAVRKGGATTLSVVNLTSGAVNPASTEAFDVKAPVVDIATPTDQ
jgi:hypothetical protein